MYIDMDVKKIGEIISGGGNHAIFVESNGQEEYCRANYLESILIRFGRKVIHVAHRTYTGQYYEEEDCELLSIYSAFNLMDDKVNNRLKYFDVLLIDEIFMVRSDEFAAIDMKMKQARNNNAPFGGVQVIVMGDIMQLPPCPVDSALESAIIGTHGSLYCFATKAWADAKFNVHKVDGIRNRFCDDWLTECLHAIHSKSITKSELTTINDRLISNGEKNAQKCQLTWYEEEARSINQQMENNIEDSQLILKSTATGYCISDFPVEDYPVDYNMILRENERIILVSMGNGYVSGVLGTFIMPGVNNDLIVCLDRSHLEVNVPLTSWEHLVVEYDESMNYIYHPVSRYIQYPVLPGYAVTVERARGMFSLIGSFHIELPSNKRTPPGFIYAALSCADTLDELSCNRRIELDELRPPEEVVKFMDSNQLW